MADIYEDIGFLTGSPGIMTHQIPAAFKAMMPWLKQRVTDQRFFDGQYDITHMGDIKIDPMTESEKAEFWSRY
jgi:hypothetical protein